MNIRAMMARKGDTPENVSKMQQELFEATYMMAPPIERVAAKFPPAPMDQELEYPFIRRKKQKAARACYTSILVDRCIVQLQYQALHLFARCFEAFGSNPFISVISIPLPGSES